MVARAYCHNCHREHHWSARRGMKLADVRSPCCQERMEVARTFHAEDGVFMRVPLCQAPPPAEIRRLENLDHARWLENARRKGLLLPPAAPAAERTPS